MKTPKQNHWVLVLIVIGGIIGAWHVRWVCDDAFISYRYAENLANGYGLVFNHGEKVEGYTNFLWTLVLSIASFSGLPLPQTSMILGIVCWTLALLGLSWRSNSWTIAATLGAACCYHVRIFATSGLETSAFFAVIVWLLRMVQFGPAWSVGLLGGLAALIRPEGALFWVLGSLSLRLDGDWRNCFRAFVVGLALLLPYAIWKLGYYGDLLPNTYYAKAGQSRWQQGWLYIGLFFSMYWSLLLGGLAAVYLSRTPQRRIAILGGSSVLVLLIHVARVGGDFMFARFCLPMIPPLLIMTDEFLLDRVKPVMYQWCAVAFGAAMLFAPYPHALTSQTKGVFGINGITEERHWYPAETIAAAKTEGMYIREILQGTDARVVFYGAQAMLAYYAQFPWAIEGMAGLTDRQLARRPARSERVAHGRKADVAYLQSRHVDLYIDFRINQGGHPLTQIDFGNNVKGIIISYRTSLLDKCKEQGAQFVDFPTYVDTYIDGAEKLSKAQIKRDLASFQRYYFQHNEDPEREKKMLQLLE